MEGGHGALHYAHTLIASFFGLIIRSFQEVIGGTENIKLHVCVVGHNCVVGFHSLLEAKTLQKEWVLM